MRKAALLIFIVSLLACSCNEKVKKEKKIRQKKEIPTYSIGINLPLTGNGSYFGEELKKGLDLSFDHFNERTEKMHLRLIYEDNKLNPKDAVTISRKFIDIDKVDLVIAAYTPIIQPY